LRGGADGRAAASLGEMDAKTKKRKAMYEPVHGSAPDIAGSGTANPCGAIASVAMMLRHSFHLEQEAIDIESAIEHVLEAGYRTPDIAKGTGGYVISTSEFGEVICEAVTEIADMRHAYHAV